MPVDPKRRIAAIVLPRLLVEMVQGMRLSLDQERERPLGVVLLNPEMISNENRSSDEELLRPTDRLTVVSNRAERSGICPGQTVTEALALVSNLQVETLEMERVIARLRAIAEVASRYGTTVCWEAPDTVWVDISGCAHLFGGEKALASELQQKVRLLGHVVRVVIASGAKVAQAVGRFSEGRGVVLVNDARAKMGELPLSALSLDDEKQQFLGKLGIFQVRQLCELPRKTASARLGRSALSILDLANGIDREPLVPGDFPKVVTEEIEWEEAVEGSSPLLFALRGLISKVSARLCGRGEATTHIEIELFHDQAIARHRGVLSQTYLEFELSSPIQKEGELERVLKSRIERLELSAPTIGLKLSVDQFTKATKVQVGMTTPGGSSWNGGAEISQELPLLLAEIQADVGVEGVGVLSLCDSHRPEKRSVLLPLTGVKNTKKKAKGGGPSSCPAMDRITRLLPEPYLLRVPLRTGETLGVGTELYTVKSLRFLQRLDGVEWWTQSAVRRDYLWAWLEGARGGTEALVFTDRQSGHSYLQALSD